MNIIITYHAKIRMKQRGITNLEILHVLQYPIHIRKIHEGRREAVGLVRNRKIKIIFIHGRNYIKIITVI
ncbi:hypothetical protein COV16_01700 [Candidatus Woesearchaeota archaeon CG10_big_fil_rev_8_21_14_0_10_34_8]|nr:MAG: hypothetical protein COV16_01700 [Candidatus Woesearchaeota archaeon CG10_big_fil_rev_8_21_14_0_10_34_8]